MEQEIREFASEHGISYIILRFFNIFGVGQSKEYAGVISKFIEKIRQDRPLEIFGDGLQTRDFVAIEDVVKSIHNSISNDKSGTYNVASGKAVTIKNLAEMMILLSERNLDIRYLAPKKEDVKCSQADISLAIKDLRYSPKFELDRIKEML